jgi:hypothetical protein
VLVVSSEHPVTVDEDEVATLAGHQVVELPAITAQAAGYAAGVRAASAPVVAFCEDHSFPAPGWAEALVAAHVADWAAVGPVVANANPGSAISWADFLLGYGPWIDPTPAGELDYLPGHNSSYKRDVLLGYEPDLEAWLEAETVLHWDLRKRGRRLYLEPRARTHHFNFSRGSSWLAATFLSGRTFAGRRLDGAGPTRRAVYVAATPLVPLIRLRRFLRNLNRSATAPPLARILPAIALELVVSAAGEAAGYALGPGSAPAQVSRYEFVRGRHVNARDRAAMESARFWEAPA